MEGPLNNLQASMIQFSKPRRTLKMDSFRRHETNAREYLPSSGTGRSGTPSRFDTNFYRTHDALAYIPSDVQSLRSQATYSSGLPMFAATSGFPPGMPRRPGGAGKRSAYGSYASSIISQDAGPPSSASIGGGSLVGSLAYSQSDRLRRRGSFSSAAGTDLGSMSLQESRRNDGCGRHEEPVCWDPVWCDRVLRSSC